MAGRSFRDQTSADAAEREARRATDALLERIAADRRCARRAERWRVIAIDLAVAMATYTGITLAMILGAVYGLGSALGLFGR